jgi:dolichol-phosphate mannosyltransferase
MQKIIVVLPTYNEVNNLPELIMALRELAIAGLAVLVVDDNSPDGTGQVADTLAEKWPDLVQVLHRPVKEGLGLAYVAGFKWALAAQATAVIQMDSDFSHAPRHIPEMLKYIKEADVVVGSRYVAGGEVDERWDPGRYLLSWWANAVYTRLLLGLKVKDGTAGFKCWRASTLQAIDLDGLSSHGYSFQFEMAYLTQKLGFVVKEIPIYFEDRRIGRSKMTIPIKLEAALRTWQILWRYRHVTPAMRRKNYATS